MSILSSQNFVLLACCTAACPTSSAPASYCLHRVCSAMCVSWWPTSRRSMEGPTAVWHWAVCWTPCKNCGGRLYRDSMRAGTRPVHLSGGWTVLCVCVVGGERGGEVFTVRQFCVFYLWLRKHIHTHACTQTDICMDTHKHMNAYTQIYWQTYMHLGRHTAISIHA